jgi:hypothetical protein
MSARLAPHARLAAFAALGWLPAAALAGPPGADTLLGAQTDCVRFVRDANENGARDPGEDTTCDDPIVDDQVFPPVVRDGTTNDRCTPATVGDLRGLLTLIADDDATDNFGAGDEAFTVLVELERGGRTFTLAESYTAVNLSDLDLGNWDERLFDEFQIFGTGMRGAYFLFGAFGQLRASLLAIGDELDLIPNQTGYEPVIVDENRDAARKRFDTNPGEPAGCGGGCGQHETDQLATPLASVAQYRVTVHFAEKLAAGGPACTQP